MWKEPDLNDVQRLPLDIRTTTIEFPEQIFLYLEAYVRRNHGHACARTNGKCGKTKIYPELEKTKFSFYVHGALSALLTRNFFIQISSCWGVIVDQGF